MGRDEGDVSPAIKEAEYISRLIPSIGIGDIDKQTRFVGLLSTQRRLPLRNKDSSA